MSYPNSGILFRNDKKQPGDNLPDYRGTAEVDGTSWEVSGWIKPSKKDPKKKFMSLSFKPPYKKSDQDPGAYVPPTPKPTDEDDGVPF
jgi:hypothetical protein